MPKTEMVRARIHPKLKRRAERILRRMGLTTTQAITLFYRQVELRKGLPFQVVIPNATTLKTFEETDTGQDLVVCKNADDMFKKLGI